ncbi:protein stum homolog [Ylistrum balloti]|uniref:protein stum homolog n=1 Tax=Ylistrum balloti TaxID=509963 RepID=UPI002905DB7B|nr:protein stum homolog [Ylistrum balloti]
MASGAGNEDAKASLTGHPKKKSVQIMDTKDEILEVTEKHGPLYNAIPCMPIGAAAVCCILNILVPGLGTFISSFTVFCGATTRIGKRVHAFVLNILAALLQMITFLVIVGWIWSILWGMNFVQFALAKGEENKRKLGPYYVRRQSSVDVP